MVRRSMLCDNGSVSETTLSPRLRWISVVSIWALALVGVVVSGLLWSPGETYYGLSATLGLCTLAAFSAQLLTRQKIGFVDRMSTSVTGSVLILALGGAVYGLIALAAG
ncbi:hypothetical protein ASF83_07415 [Plantibacter sp. Leaf171]|nr:hypothetical protein ASE44_07430 [Plantibacter sp. Leaf1]KQR58893.1 hypothetical protein ASF83_07415 [Plantibacter sp. Leaf171]